MALYLKKKTCSLRVEVSSRLKFVSYYEMVEGCLKSETSQHQMWLLTCSELRELAGVWGMCVCIWCIPTWFGSFTCGFLDHLVLLLYEMTHNRILGLWSNYSLIYKFAFFKTSAIAELTLPSLPWMSLSILFHLLATSWKFFEVLACGCSLFQVCRAHRYILRSPKSLGDKGEN